MADTAGTPTTSAHRIAALRPSLLVAAAYTATPRWPNLSAAVLALLREHGVAVLAYVDTAFGQRAVDEVLAETAEVIRLGVNGVLFDQVAHQWGTATERYYGALAEGVRAGGGLVALNTGVAATDEACMAVADLLMIEHDWRVFAALNPWRHRYDPLRFMGVSSNEPGAQALLGYKLDADTAKRDTHDAWSLGVGWHCATDRYIDVPPWS